MDGFILTLQHFFDTNLFSLGVLPVLIFFARVVDVSLGTLRIIFTSRGKRYIAPLFGFVEVFIWVVAMGQIMKNVNNITAYLAYAAGFAAGNFVGMYIEDKLALGTLIVRIILKDDPSELTGRLHEAGYGTTCVDAHGATGSVTLIYTIVKRRDFQAVVDIIHKLHPKAFLAVEEVRSTQEGIFPPRNRPLGSFSLRKSK